jgi:hypothetical protein
MRKVPDGALGCGSAWSGRLVRGAPVFFSVSAVPLPGRSVPLSSIPSVLGTLHPVLVEQRLVLDSVRSVGSVVLGRRLVLGAPSFLWSSVSFLTFVPFL